MNRSNYCSCCGALRGLSARNQAYSLHDIVPVEPHRPMQRGDGRLFEMSPQLIVHVGVYRNGGGSADEHICNDCLMVGIRHALEALEKLVPASQPETPAAATVSEPENWRELAAKVMDALADAQEQTNATCPEHVKCYPQWVSQARWLRWHADMFRTGKPVGNGAGQPAVLAALAAQQAADSVLEDAAHDFPELKPELANILGTICFQCIPFAQALRAAGHQIKTRAEDEQAAVLHWMLGHYFRHGEDEWRKAAAEDMKRMQAAALAAKGGAL